MRKIEITEDLLRDAGNVYNKGDTISVDDTKAAQWIALGWAKDADTGEQGERKPGAQRLSVHAVTQNQN